MANQPRDVVERLHSEKRREEHEKEKQKTLMQPLYNHGEARHLLAGLILCLYEEASLWGKEKGKWETNILDAFSSKPADSVVCSESYIYVTVYLLHAAHL